MSFIELINLRTASGWAYLVVLLQICTTSSCTDPGATIENRVYRKATYQVSAEGNPADCLSTAEQTVANLVYRGLFLVRGGLEIENDLVDEWTLDRDSGEYRFSMNLSGSFSDGSPMSLRAVQESLEFLFFSSKNKDSFKHVASVGMIEPRTISVKVRDINSSLIPLLAAPQAKIWRKGGESGRWPIGAGAYKVSGFSRSPYPTLHLVRNEHYRGGRPFRIERFDLLQMAEGEAKQAVIRGQVEDTIDFPVGSPLPDSPDYQSLSGPSAITWLLAFNVRHQSLSSRSFRKCLEQYFDRNSFIKAFLPGHDDAEGYLPSSIVGSRRMNRGVVSRCGAGSGEPIVVLIPRELENASRMCSFLQETWRPLLRNLKCELVSFEQLLLRIAAKSHHVALMAMSMDFPSVDYLLNVFESSSQLNLSALASSEYDSILRRIRNAANMDEKRQLYHDADRYLYDQAVSVNISYPKTLAYAGRCVVGLAASIAGPAYTDYSRVSWKEGCRR